MALLLASRFDYTVVISDLKMPDCSGVELHDHIAAIAPELLDRIVFSTGDVASRDAADVRADEHGARCCRSRSSSARSRRSSARMRQ